MRFNMCYDNSCLQGIPGRKKRVSVSRIHTCEVLQIMSDNNRTNTKLPTDWEENDGLSENEHLGGNMDPQWGEMLDSFAQNDSASAFDDDFSDDFSDDLSDDLSDDFSDGAEEKDSVEPDGFFDDDFSPEENQVSDPVAHPRAHKPSYDKNMIIRLCIVVVSTLFGIGVLFYISMNHSAGNEDIPIADSSMEEYVATTSSDAPDANSSQQPVSSMEQVSSTEEVSSVEEVSSDETTSSETKYKTLKKGDKGKAVLKMQKRLCRLGYIKENSCTGYYGEFTEKIIKQFQKAAGLKQTGKADSKTLTRLYADDAPKAK